MTWFLFESERAFLFAYSECGIDADRLREHLRRWQAGGVAADWPSNERICAQAVSGIILTASMSEPTRRETQLGLADFKKRLSAVGLNVTEQQDLFDHHGIYFAIGNNANQTTIALSRAFLDDLPNTKDYHPIVDSYARAVAGRLKSGSPELFYCQSGVAVRVSIRWPIHSAIYENKLSTSVLMDVINQADGQIAKCSIEVGSRLGRTVFDIVLQTVNSVRTAIDLGQVKFNEPQFHQEVYQRIEYRLQPQERRTQSGIEDFLSGKAYLLGFFTVDEPTEVWAVDPWDAQYLGVTVKDLSLAMRVLRANGLLQAGASPEYVRPTDKLLADHSAKARENESFAFSQQKLSRTSLPNKDELLKDMQGILKQHPTSSLVVIDLDNFKAVNDTKSHSEGDACLDKVIATIGAVVGRRGKIYRWGSGDEFIVCLPDFSTIEAQATAERIRSAVEQGKPGGDIQVTTSIGVCGTDCTESKSPEEILDFADKAMYESKHGRGKNFVAAWPLSSTGSKAATTNKRISEDERRKLADTVIVSGKTNNGHNQYYTISVRNHSKKFDLVVNGISLWSDGQRVSSPVFRPEGANWTVRAEGEISINFDAGEDVSHRLWILAGAPSKTDYVMPGHLPGHFDAKVRVDITYEVLEIEKTYSETGMVQVDPTNHAITGL